jgi:chromosome segregation ATPase
MNRTELTLLIAGSILLAVLIGWTLRWFFVRLTNAGSHPAGSNELAARLHDAEEARDAAFAERDSAISELRNKLGQTEAELRAAMDGLGDARREAEDLRATLEASKG